MYFNQKDYKKALAKYTRVQAYTNAILPSKNAEVQQLTSLSKTNKDKVVEGEML